MSGRPMKDEKKDREVNEKKKSHRSVASSMAQALEKYGSGEWTQVYSELQKVCPEMEKKKTLDMTADERYSQLSNWSYIRPYMSFDFAGDNTVLPAPSLSVIPESSQENIILDEVLNILLGFQGRYIVAQPLLGNHEPRTFTVTDSIEPTLRQQVQQILSLAADYSLVQRFIEEKRLLKWGRVNQALATAFNTFIDDYTVFIVQMESLQRKNELSLQNLWFYLQSTMQTFQVLAKIANSINQSEAKGGRTLTILYEETQHYIPDNNAQKLCLFLTGEAAVPYFQSLQRWLHKGIVSDPFQEFLIKDNVEMETDTNTVTGLYSDEYWSKRYTICEANVPAFLCHVQEIILRTGRYLNVIRQCSETTSSSADFAVPPVEALVFSLHGEQYLSIIEKAYQFASSSLLDLLLTKYDIINRIKSLKRYFLMEQGDFIVQLLDLCDEELSKPISEVVPSRLQTLFELALRTSTGKHDPYKEDMTLTILTENNTYQIFKILSYGAVSVGDDKLTQLQQCSRTGLEGFAFQLVSKWPLSLLFNQKIIGCYQMLFRHLFNCKYVDRRLCQVWIHDKAVKQLPQTAAAGYRGAFSLRQRMLFCVQNLEYYMMEEAIEPNWIRFMSRVSAVRNIDDLLVEHWDFVDQCMKDCMFMNHELVAIINQILAACTEFCDFIQSSENVYNKDAENQSFEKNVKRLDGKFNSHLSMLLATISSLGQGEDVNKLRNILYRENFNGFYSSMIEKDPASVTTSG